MKKIIDNILDVIWPHLTGKGTPKRPDVTEKDISRWADLDLLLKEARLSYNSETDRMKQVESKGSIGIGLTGFISTIVVAFFSKPMETDFGLLGTVYIAIVLLYCAASVYYSIKALLRSNFSDIDVESYLKTDGNKLKEKLIVEYINATSYNNFAINRKVDNMNMAQRFSRNAIICLCFWPIIKIITGLFSV